MPFYVAAMIWVSVWQQAVADMFGLNVLSVAHYQEKEKEDA